MNRRDFLRAAALAPVYVYASPLLQALRGEGEKPDLGPLEPHVRRFLEAARTGSPPRPTGLDRNDYLDVVLGIVRFFRNFQNERGAIIDPYTEGERQYSTPCYAHCVAVLCAARPGLRPELLESGAKAMDWAVNTLVEGRAADHHGDFFTVKLMHALRFFHNQVDRERVRKWESELRQLLPTRSYQATLERKGTPDGIHNWNFVALTGEFLRARAGLGGMDFVFRYLPIQMTRFTPHGMYVDPHNPMAYDVFTRYHLALLLANGYDGEHIEQMWQYHLRGGWSALFLQSPVGEVPCGGRSAHHQWNEAAQSATFEILAGQLWRSGMKAAASAFKRAARLGLSSVKRWVRVTGELWIVKNRFDPSARWGFESYSYHSQYNLLAASMLANAYTYADEEIPEGWTPAELGGFVFTLDDGELPNFPAPGFRKTVANCAGMYVLIDHAADHGYNPTGVLRLHGLDHRGISDGSVNTSHYRKRNWTREVDGPGTVALSPIWQRAESVDGLSLYDYEMLGRSWQVTEVKQRQDAVSFTAIYEIPSGTRVVRRFRLSGGKLVVREEVHGEGGPAGVLWPLWTFDGREIAKVEVGQRYAAFALDGTRQLYRVLGPETVELRLRPGEWPFRNGFLRATEVWSDRNWVEYEVLLQAT